jgi:prepilin-type N-terminal cleavage/methylation domain-containing protein
MDKRDQLQSNNHSAFTLIELLVVIAIIAILAALLLPALARGRDNATGAVCLSNQKQLTMAFKMYNDDNNGNFVPYHSAPIDINGTIQFMNLNGGGIWPADASVTVPETGVEQRGAQIKARIKLGPLISRYARNPNVLHCPGDLRSKLPLSSSAWAFDSYSCGGGVNGEHTGESLTKETQLRSPARQWVFVEDSDSRGHNVGSWVMDPESPAAIDNLPVFHNNTGTQGYADGHSVMHRWLDVATLTQGRIAARGLSVVFGAGCMGPQDARYMAAGYIYKDWPPRWMGQ